MTVRKMPIDLKGLKFVEQVSWAAGDPGAGYAGIRAFDIKFDPSRNMVRPGYQKPEANLGPDPAKGGGKGGTLTFKTYLRGGKGAESAFAKLAKYCGFTVKNNPDLAAEVKSANNDDIVLDTTPTSYEVGDAICVKRGTEVQIRFVSRVQDGVPAGDATLDIEPNWNTNPQAGDSLYSIDTLTPSIGEPTKYITFRCYSGQGATDSHRWDLVGCAGTFKLVTTSVDTNPIIEWSYQVDTWDSNDQQSTTQAADAYNPVHPLLGDKFFIDDTATKITSIGFDPATKLAAYKATEGTNGRAGWHYHGEEPVLDFMPYFDVDWISKWENETTFQAMFESVKDEDEAWALYVPKVQVLNVTEEDSGSELVGSKMEFELCDPEKNADSVQIPRFAIAVTGA